jgi:hypothetical protein
VGDRVPEEAGCHGDINSDKIVVSHATLFLEDTAMDTFLASSFGSFVMVLFQRLLTAPSWQSFALLACGWALAPRQHTITTYL